MPPMQTIGMWGLREEARKSWDYVVSDEVIHRSDVIYGDYQFSHVLAEQYLDGDSWFEAHWTLIKLGQRETHFQCIYEVAQVSSTSEDRKVESKRIGIHRDRPMFVHSPKLIELPERMSPVVIPSAIRLKLVDDVCHCGWKQLAPVLVGGVVLLEDQKTNLPLFGAVEALKGRKMCESPSQLVKSCPEATNEITEQHGNDFRHNLVLNPADMDGLIEIVIVGDGVWFRINPVLNGYLKRVEMKLRPTGFHIYVDEPRVNRCHGDSLVEWGTIGA